MTSMSKAKEKEIDVYIVKASVGDIVPRRVLLKEEKKLGIDRVWIVGGKMLYTVEYKHDFASEDTGNIFIETMSNTYTGSLGWVYTSRAQILVTLVHDALLFAYMPNVKSMMCLWAMIYPEKPCDNNGYRSYGLPVPRSMYEKECFEIIKLEEFNNADELDRFLVL